MARKMEFRMERDGLIQVGNTVALKEDTANTMAGVMFYYTIKDAIAMSNNTENLLSNYIIKITRKLLRYYLHQFYLLPVLLANRA